MTRPIDATIASTATQKVAQAAREADLTAFIALCASSLLARWSSRRLIVRSSSARLLIASLQRCIWSLVAVIRAPSLLPRSVPSISTEASKDRVASSRSAWTFCNLSSRAARSGMTGGWHDHGHLVQPGSPPGARAGYWPPAMLTSQLTPYLSTHMPKTSPQGALSSGMDTVPPSDSLSQ